MAHMALLAVLLGGGGTAIRLAWRRIATWLHRTPADEPDPPAPEPD